MVEMYSAQTVSLSIGRPLREVYEFVSNPENFPQWAKGLGAYISKKDDAWLVETPQGPVKIRFAARNNLGVVDHCVTTSDGTEIYVPMRVLANGAGSEILFTLYRSPGMTEDVYARDLKLVREDLQALKRILETKTDSAGK